MQDKHLFEYAVIRIVPRVEREEFLNAGIILFCKQQQYLETIFTVNKEKIKAFNASVDVDEVEQYLTSLQKISRGDKTAGPIAQMDVASRFRWLTATRSTVVQTSKVHPGLCSHMPATLQRLFQEFVL